MDDHEKARDELYSERSSALSRWLEDNHDLLMVHEIERCQEHGDPLSPERTEIITGALLFVRTRVLQPGERDREGLMCVQFPRDLGSSESLGIVEMVSRRWQ